MLEYKAGWRLYPESPALRSTSMLGDLLDVHQFFFQCPDWLGGIRFCKHAHLLSLTLTKPLFQDLLRDLWQNVSFENMRWDFGDFIFSVFSDEQPRWKKDEDIWVYNDQLKWRKALCQSYLGNLEKRIHAVSSRLLTVIHNDVNDGAMPVLKKL